MEQIDNMHANMIIMNVYTVFMYRVHIQSIDLPSNPSVQLTKSTSYICRYIHVYHGLKFILHELQTYLQALRTCSN